MKAPSAMRILRSVPAMRPPGSPRRGVPGRLHIRAAGERPPRARPQRRGSPGPIPNPAVKPAFAESTAAQGCGRAGRRARGGRFSYARSPAPARLVARAARAGRGPQGGSSPCGPLLVNGGLTIRRRWLGLHFLGTLLYRKDCALDARRHGAGCICTACVGGA